MAASGIGELMGIRPLVIHHSENGFIVDESPGLVKRAVSSFMTHLKSLKSVESVAFFFSERKFENFASY
jgi:hypothetical protein